MDYSKLTDAEVNERLALAMGWEPDLLYPLSSWSPPKGKTILKDDWSPCTSRDDLAVVVEHTEKTITNKVYHQLTLTLNSFAQRADKSTEFFLLTCPPRIIAEACLEVLEG